jgi:thioredoxin-related protein
MISRRIFLCLLFSLFSFPVLAAQLSFHSYEDGLEIAKSQDKMVYVLFGADHCPWCHKQKDVLLDDEVLGSLSDYVMVYVDTSEERDLSSKYKIKSIPVSMILNSDGSAARKNVGYMDKFKFLRWIR